MSANHINSVGMESLCNSIFRFENPSNNGKLIAKLWLSGKNGITSSSIVLIDEVDVGLLTKKSAIYFK